MVVLFYIFAFIAANCFIGYVLYTGMMFTRIPLRPVDGREATPVLYWLYVIGLGLPVLIADCWVVHELRKAARKHD